MRIVERIEHESDGSGVFTASGLGELWTDEGDPRQWPGFNDIGLHLPDHDMRMGIPATREARVYWWANRKHENFARQRAALDEYIAYEPLVMRRYRVRDVEEYPGQQVGFVHDAAQLLDEMPLPDYLRMIDGGEL